MVALIGECSSARSLEAAPVAQASSWQEAAASSAAVVLGLAGIWVAYRVFA